MFNILKMVLITNIFKHLGFLNDNKPLNLIKIFYIYFLFFPSIMQCYIKIPIKYYPYKIFNETNPSNTIHNILVQRLYATIELGSPKQVIQIPIEFETNDFYISKSETKINDEKYKMFKLEHFEEKSSNSLEYLDEEDVYYGVNFLLGTRAKDYFYFGNKKVELEFYLADHLAETLPGELGLQLNVISDLNTAFDTIEKSFLKILKNKKLTSNYVYSIIYKNKNYINFNNDQIDGYLYIGDYLHNIDKKYDYSRLTSIPAFIFQNIVRTEFLMNKLIIYRNNNPKDIINEIKLNRNYLRVNLDYNYGGIIGSEIIRPYLEEYLFTKKNNCYKDTFNYKNKFYFYYCENNPSKIKNIKDNFPTLQFTHQDFNYDFIIKGDELFIEKDGYIFCLMVFDDYKRYEWKFGRPFLNKYIFMVDQEAKKVLFYSVEDNVKITGIKKATSVFIIVILMIIFSFLGFILARKIYRIHKKKHSNIIEDDFEYNEEPKNKKGSNIEMTRKLYSNE